MKYDVLLADTDEQSTELLSLMFDEYFDLDIVKNAQEIFQAVSAKSYQFIILEYHLDGENGLEICRKLQEMDADDRPAIIFLTSQDDENIIKQAYELGVSDYICKPFNIVVFHERLIALSRDIEKVRQLQQRDSEVNSMAETALKQSAYYGNGLELLARLNTCYEPFTLAQEVCQNLKNQGYNVAMQLRGEEEIWCLDLDHDPAEGSCNEMSKKVFDLLKDKGRIYRFGHRCMYNDDTVSLLVKNMPSEGTMSYDALIDLAAKLVPAINARFVAILEHQALVKAKSTLEDALQMLAMGIRDLNQDKENIMQNIKMKIGMSFHHLELEEQQEQYLAQLIEKEIGQQQEDTTLSELQALIARCVSSLNAVSDAPKQAPTSDAESADIELF